MEYGKPSLWTIASFSQELFQSLSLDDAGQFKDAPKPLSTLKVHGTTIGALRVDGGSKIVAFSDGKGSVMDLAFQKDMDKVLQVDDHSCLLISGSAAYGVLLGRAFRSYIAVRQNTDQRILPASAKVSFLRRALMDMLPMAAQGMGVMPLFATFDHGHAKEGRIYLLTMDGTSIPVDCKLIGSGFPVGNGPLEYRYAEAMKDHGKITLEMGIAIAKCVLDIATTNDNASGGTWTIKIIDADGVQSIKERAK